MLDLNTGLPGAGKTNYTLSTIEKRRIQENRQVYYHGISEVTLDWLPLEDPKLWFELPVGCIIVIDEAWRVFPLRPNGSPVPRHEEELATHRHRGYDLVFVCQDPGQLSSFVRKLVDTHRHLMEKFGSSWVTIHQFKGCRDTVGKSRKDSLSSQWMRDKSMYGKYKSAEVHTKKIRVPWKIWAAAALPFVMLYFGYGIYQRRFADQPLPPVAVVQAPSAPGAPGARPGAASAIPPAPVQAEKRTYDLEAFAPRLEGLPHTAPRYDELTAPVRVPTVAGCVWFEKSKRGHCYTQQGTILKPPESFIRQYVAHGMFEDHERGPGLGHPGATIKAGDDSKPGAQPVPAPVAIAAK